MPHVVAALGSRPAPSQSLRGGRRGSGPAPREPKGARHAVDVETGDAACGTLGLQRFDDLPWDGSGDLCPTCEELVPAE